MALWNQLRARAQDMTTQLKTKTGQFKNKEFANASMAMCALIAAADGSIDNAERAKVSGLITSNEALKVFPQAELTQKFDFYASKLQSNFDFGKLEATQTIAKLKAKPDQARAVIQIGIIIGGADGNFDDYEKAAVRDACNTLGIPPAEFDL
jgi:tellurite resistance protein TerB